MLVWGTRYINPIINIIGCNGTNTRCCPNNGKMPYIYIPGSSKCVKFVPFHPKDLPKGRNFTYLEGPGMHIYI